MKRKSPHSPSRVYSDDFKRQVVSDYIESSLSKQDILDKYEIRASSAIQEWMRKFGVADPYVKMDRGIINQHRLKKKNPELPEPELQKQALTRRIKELEKELVEEKLRSEMFVRVI